MATPEEMDEAAKLAESDLKKLDPEKVKVVAEWWNSHFRQSGHKRLGRLLVTFAREPEAFEGG